jgi:ATP phosphoribosyltransferase regulatory subunit
MTDDALTALLPEGLHDELPPEASRRAAAVNALMERFQASGFERIEPPLIEFEESLLSGPGAKQAQDTFRIMDPVSHRMMGLRADMTIQAARIATTRLKAVARPLRLAYAGDVLRVRGSQLRPERQFAQAGVELIGSASLEADVEVILLAAETLADLGVRHLSADLTVPSLVPTLCAELGLANDVAAEIREALDGKDVAHLSGLGDGVGALLKGLLRAAGPSAKAMKQLSTLGLPAKSKAMIATLGEVVARVGQEAPELTLTVDPGEYRGFEYQTGVSFTMFARGVRGELGRGGRYEAGAEKDASEPATGFSLYVDSLLPALPKPRPQDKLYLPFGTPEAEAKRLRTDGMRTIRGLEKVGDAKTEAKRLGCSHYWDGRAVKTAG